jgi:cytochrome c2
MAALATVSPAVADVAQGDAERGRKLLSQYQCGSCHTIPGVASAGGKRAPSLQSFGLRSYIAGRVANRPGLLERWIVQPQSLVPGTLMPSMGVSPADARDMAAYLLELR